jgi:hypothetical protein
MRLAASRIQFLHGAGGQYSAIFHTLAASTVQSRQWFESTLPEQLFEWKNEDTIKKSENLRDKCTS